MHTQDVHRHRHAVKQGQTLPVVAHLHHSARTAVQLCSDVGHEKHVQPSKAKPRPLGEEPERWRRKRYTELARSRKQ